MKFTANTKPIVDGLELGIISANITKFYQRSCIVELTVEDSTLRVNTEASAIKSELVFKGRAEGEGCNHVFVDSLLFRDLMKSIETDVVEFDLNEDCLTVYSGKSKFNLPQVSSAQDIELARPAKLTEAGRTFEISKDSWEFIKTNQLYAIAMSFIHPVYTNVWVGESGDVVVGDYDNSIFTHSNKLQLADTCLLPETVINLLTTVPETASIMQVGKNYEIRIDADPYTYLCEFAPKYESDEGVGDYNAGIILELFAHEDESIKINTDKIYKYISQAELFVTPNDQCIDLEVTADSFNLVNKNVNCKVPIENPFAPFKVTFQISMLKDFISHLDSKDVNVSPFMVNDEPAGIVVWTEEMSAVLGGVE